MKNFIHVIYARKPCDWHEIESATRRTSGTAYPTEVVDTKEMTAAEYDAFVTSPMTSRVWLAGKGGWKNKNVRRAIAVTAPERETIYVDPSGADYGRYVGRRVDSDTVVKYPDIRVKLVGMDGNAFIILGLCKRAAQKGGLGEDEIKAFFDEAKAGDYNHLLMTCMRWFDCH